VVALVLGAAVFVERMGRHSPISTWLFFRYARAWLLVAVFSLACVAVGHVLVRALAPWKLDLRERLVLGFAAGALVFGTLMFVAGITGLFGGAVFVLLPLALIAFAGPRAFRDLFPEVRLALARAQQAPRPPVWWSFIVGLGALAVFLVYLPILTPANVSYDSRWYHLAIAEHYAADGAIRPFPEGLLAGTYPELATLIYTWAFLSPWGDLFDRIELAAHLEFAVFLVTLAGIPALVRQLVPGSDARWSWAAFFLFPAIFVYDSELCCGADHIAALFAVPIFLALFRAWPTLEPRASALVGIFVSGALSTKYTAVSLAVGPVVAVVVRALRIGALRGLACFVATVVVVTSQQWLRNWVFYGDPVYPMLASWFHPRPWTVDSAAWYRTFQETNSIPGTLLVSGPRDLLRILTTFSFEVHDFPDFHGKVPVFGSLFTIATVALLFLRGVRRIWALVLATYAGLTFWALLSPQDRYLQALLPWMVCVTVATLVLTWRVGWPARAAVCALVAVQMVWAGDIYFLPSHGMTRVAPVRAAIDLIGSRYGANGPRLTPLEGWPEIGRNLPRGARVLLHEQDVHLGLQAPAVLDLLPFSYGIDYGRTRSMREMDALLRSMGVTHLLWETTSHRADSFAGDLMFLSFATRHAKQAQALGPFLLAAMPDVPPDDAPLGDVVIIGCAPGPYASGIYRVDDLAVPPIPRDSPSRYPAPRLRWEALAEQQQVESLEDAEFVVAEGGCRQIPSRARFDGRIMLAQRGPYTFFARARKAAP
jgi:hypothetical protein